MGEIAIVVVVVIVVLALIGNARNRKKAAKSAKPAGGGARTGTRPQRSSKPGPKMRPQPENRPYESGKLPENLGLAADVPLQETAAQLELSFGEHFGERLKRRLLDKYSQMTEAEYEWKLLELKRYLLMNTILRQVPMFSPEVDDIWHEMLMFTREYERFCEHWNGRTVHHAPHGEPTPMPGERAWFDWVYSQLFVPTPYTGRIWRGFFRYPLDRELLALLQGESAESIAEARFNIKAATYNPEVGQTVELLIRKGKEQIEQATKEEAAVTADARANGDRSGSSRYASDPAYAGAGSFGALASSMLIFSMIDPLGYEQRMEEVLPEEEKRNQTSCGSSSCSTVYADDSDRADTDGGDSGDGSGGGDASGDSSSCSSSSCSSSSCSSGCGGGGD